MPMKPLTRGATLLIIAFAGAPRLSAAPAGLNVITTADLLERGEVALGYQNDGLRPLGADCNHWGLLQIGLLDRLEVGLDRCFEGDETTLTNIKVLLQSERPGRPAVALGVQNVGAGAGREPYLALAKDLGRTRLHLGAIGLEGGTRTMLGVEYRATGAITLYLDRVSGADDSMGVGIGADLGDGVAISVGRLFANSSAGEHGWLVVVSRALPPGR